MTTDILLSHLRSGLFPANKAPYICKAGIYIGKLNGVIQQTFP
jgi:hypothetical protein